MAEAMAQPQDQDINAKGPPLLFVDVNLTPTQTERIAIWEEDDPADIANDFAALHSLGVAPKAQLEQLVSDPLATLHARHSVRAANNLGFHLFHNSLSRFASSRVSCYRSKGKVVALVTKGQRQRGENLRRNAVVALESNPFAR